MEEFLYENNYASRSKKDFNVLLNFYDAHKIYNNASTVHTYTFSHSADREQIQFQFFPFSQKDITLTLDSIGNCTQEHENAPTYHIPKLLLTSPYFDIRNLSIYINPSEDTRDQETGKITNIQRSYYSSVYPYTLPNGETVQVPTLLPYYTFSYSPKEHESSASNILRINYEEHTLESYDYIDHTSFSFEE